MIDKKFFRKEKLGSPCRGLKGLLPLVCAPVIFVFFPASFLYAGDSYLTADTMRTAVLHDLVHFVDTPKMTKRDIVDALGDPDYREERFAGREYWYYQQAVYKGVAITQKQLPFLVFRNGTYVTRAEYYRSKRPNLERFFFFIGFVLWWPFSVGKYVLVLLPVISCLALLIPRWGIFLCVYLVLGCVLAFTGVLF